MQNEDNLFGSAELNETLPAIMSCRDYQRNKLVNKLITVKTEIIYGMKLLNWPLKMDLGKEDILKTVNKHTFICLHFCERHSHIWILKLAI